MTKAQKDRLTWKLADLCASSARLAKIKKERSTLWTELSKQQDHFFQRVVNFVDEIAS